MGGGWRDGQADVGVTGETEGRGWAMGRLVSGYWGAVGKIYRKMVV